MGVAQYDGCGNDVSAGKLLNKNESRAAFDKNG